MEDEGVHAMFAAMTPRARARLLASWRASQRAARGPPSCLRDLRGATYPHGEGFNEDILERFNNTLRGKGGGRISFFTVHKADEDVVALFEHLAEEEGKDYEALRHELVVGAHTAKGKEKLQDVGDGAETVGFNVYVDDNGRLQLCSGGGATFTPETLKDALRDELSAESPNVPLVALIERSVYRDLDPALLLDAILKGDPKDLEVTAWSARTGAPFDLVLRTRGETGPAATSLFGGAATARFGTDHLVSGLRLRGGSGGGGGGGGEVDVDDQLDCLLAWLGLIFAAFWSMHPQSPGNGGVGITRTFEPEVVGAWVGAMACCGGAPIRSLNMLCAHEPTHPLRRLGDAQDLQRPRGAARAQHRRPVQARALHEVSRREGCVSNTRCRVWRSLAGPGRPQHLPACCHTQWQSVAGAAPLLPGCLGARQLLLRLLSLQALTPPAPSLP